MSQTCQFYCDRCQEPFFSHTDDPDDLPDCPICHRSNDVEPTSPTTCARTRKPVAVMPARRPCPRPKKMPAEAVAAGLKALRESITQPHKL